jgi:hypothetical protein
MIQGRKKTAIRFRFDDSGVAFVDAKGIENRIPFSEIEALKSSFDERGYVEIEKIDKSEVILGPGIGGLLGKSLLETYARWAAKKLGERVEIRKEEVRWARVGWYVVRSPMSDH